MQQQNTVTLSDLNIHFDQILGRGGFAVVYKATHKKTGKTYAVKKVT